MTWPNSVTKKDLKIEAYRSSGPGGQHANKSNTAIRITHKPTKISAQCRSYRSQHRNKIEAFRTLAEKLIPLMKQEIQRQRYNAPEIRIRTYHELDQRVTDVRLPNKQWRYKDVVYGNGLNEIIEELLLICP